MIGPMIRVIFDKSYISGLILLCSGILALIFSNTSLKPIYDALLSTAVEVRVGSIGIDKPLLLWINDGMMAIFFLLVGLEIKRELLVGRLSTVDKAILPCIAALGGVVCPALIYIYINRDYSLALRGWAIPTATDIAFALGILSLVGDKVPRPLTLLLMTIAILDDLLAIFIIAVFYSFDLSLLSLSLAGIAIAILMFMNIILKVKQITPYVLVGLCLWVFVLKSGVHATLAGVVIAFSIPLRGFDDDRRGAPLDRLIKSLYPWVTFMIVPLFAFANAGVSMDGMTLNTLFAHVPLGIWLGLFLGKQLGVFGFAWLSVKCKIAALPEGVSWLNFYGMAILCGIGFTMSLFIGSLAFPHGESTFALTDRIGILFGSLISGIMGFIVMRISLSNQVKNRRRFLTEL